MSTRLDVEMARRGLAKSREGAQRLIMAGRVRLDSRPALKPDLKVDQSTEISLLPGPSEYASRGAYKLMAALDRFKISVEGRYALDVGASNGGFTDVLLRAGAAKVIALDVGYGQLAARLRSDNRVIVMDRTNIRNTAPEDLAFRPNLVTIDVSFISLRLVLPKVVELSASAAELIALLKPQFEVGRGRVGKGGVVRDENLRQAALVDISGLALSLGLRSVGSMDSPIRGAAGNLEFLCVFSLQAENTA
ncbi:MAG TPA: TlyA family RNA methyltransferase [Candidatus Binataceae bacterium]